MVCFRSHGHSARSVCNTVSKRSNAFDGVTWGGGGVWGILFLANLDKVPFICKLTKAAYETSLSISHLVPKDKLLPLKLVLMSSGYVAAIGLGACICSCREKASTVPIAFSNSVCSGNSPLRASISIFRSRK